MDDHEVIYLKVDPSCAQGHGKRATLCETLLGFVPGHFLPGDNRIMVAGIVPDGALVKMGGGIQVGDWLMCINDLDVSHDNVDALLSAVTRPKKIKLTVQSPNKRSQTTAAASINIHHQRSNSTVSSSSSQSISSSILRPLGRVPSDASSDSGDIDHVTHVVMYLTTEVPAAKTKSDSSSREDHHAKQDDVIYVFPKREGNKITELRGLFETLPQLLLDVTDNAVKSSTLIVDDEKLHVAYIRCEPEVLIFGAPANHVSAQQLRDLIRDLSRLLLVIYGSLQSAFRDPINQKQMDQFLKVFLGQVLGKRRSNQDPNLLNSVENKFFSRLIDAVKWIPLNHSIRSLISSTLSNYESADFAEISDDYYDIRRQYTIVGTTLCYKGCLIGSHLPKEDLLDISLYLKYTSLLQISATQVTVDPIVVWREAFPTRRYHDPSGDAPVLGYSEPVDARWFLLVVGLKKMLLTALLEAGGCSQWAEGSSVSPNAFYVDQAKSCLHQLESLDIPGSCELALNQFAPTTAFADGVNNSSQPEETISTKKPSSPSVTASRSSISNRGTSSISSLKNELDNISLASSGGEEMKRANSINSIESGDSSVSSSALSFRGKLRGKTSGRFMPSLEQLSRKSSNLSEDGEGHRLGSGNNNNATSHLQRQIQASAGAENSLFHYLYFQEVEGIFVAADDNFPDRDSLGKPSFHADIVKNFYTSALTIRNTFEDALKAEEDNRGNSNDQFHHPHHQQSQKENLGRFAHRGPNQGRVYEEGILFHFTSSTDASGNGKRIPERNSDSQLTYWVVGRMFREPEPQQIFVCFQDGVDQSLVELAFKLGFGIGI